MSSNRKANLSRIFMVIIVSTVLIFSLVTPKHAQAATLTVNTLVDENDGSCSDGDCSLRDAIQVAAAGDTITFSISGTIILNLGQLSIDKNLTISGPGSDSLTVDGSHKNNIFFVSGINVNISGLTIANGSADNGGGLYNLGTTTLTNVIFSSNYAGFYGGGMYNEGNATLTNVTFNGNYGNGGMYNNGITTLMNVTFSGNSGHGMVNSGNATLTNVIFSKNTGNYGAGMINAPSSISTLTNVTFSGNSGNYGGGLYNDSHLTSSLTNVIFSGNSATEGGGLDTYSITQLKNVTFSGNSAATGGGMSIVIGNSNILTLMNVTFSGNTATNYGGGISNYLGTSILTNVTFNNNSAGNGGGIYVWNGSTLMLKNTLLAGGDAPTGPDCAGTLISYGYNLIQDTTGCTITGDLTGNIYGKDPLLGPLAHNGGYTLTHALLPGSPAIDAADFTDPYGNPVIVDQRGVTRPQGLANDIGAYEFINHMHFWFPVVFK